MYLIINSINPKKKEQDGGKKSTISPIRTILVFMDFFDSFIERKRFFKTIADQSPDTSFILFNLPGQPYTSYNKSAILNNTYYSNAIDNFIYYLEESGKVNILADPFGIIGFGNGANIALYWSIYFYNNSTKSWRFSEFIESNISLQSFYFCR